MSDWTICFDFTDDGTPLFVLDYDGIGFTASLETAKRFESEQSAERFLANVYGPSVRACGAVVEVAS